MAQSNKPQEFRQRAAECERLAAIGINTSARETLLYVAAGWRAMADEEEHRFRPRELQTQ
jgi:hypothetical protein